MTRHHLLIFFFLFLNLHLSGKEVPNTLSVGYTPAPPFIIERDGKIEGISVWLWQRCAKELQLEYELVPMPFREMLDSVETGGIDVSINPLTITSGRLNNISFTHSFYASHSVITKGHLSFFESLRSFLESIFSLGFLSGFLALLGLIGLFGFLEWHFEHKVNPEHFRKGWKGFWDGLWWSVVTMTTVGYGDKTPQSRGGKIVALVWMFSGLLFISGITASVASSLTVGRLVNESIDLNDFKDREVGTIAHSSSEQCLKDNFFKDIQPFSNVELGLDALVNHELDAFVYDEPIVRYRLLNDKKYEDLVILPTKFKVQFYAFGLPKKHTALNALLSQKMLNIIERSSWEEVLNEYGGGTE